MPEYFYEVALDCKGAAVDARVNDGPLWFQRRRSGGTFEIVANRWVRNGENKLSMGFVPFRGDKSLGPGFRCGAKVYERERGAARESRRQVAEKNIELSDISKLLPAPDGGLMAEVEFTVQGSFPEWSWIASPRIADSPETLAALLREIDSIHDFLAHRNMAALTARLWDRDREMAAAHFDPFDKQRAETLRDFEAMAADEEMPLEPRETAELRLRLYGDGRLARVEDANGDSPIYFLSRDEKLVRFVPFVFCQRADRSWMIIR